MYLNYEVEFFLLYIECQYWTKDWICLAWLQIHGLLMSCYPKLLDGLSHLTPSQHLSMMMRKIFHCLGNHQLAVFSPINLVLSVVSLELEQITPNWFSIISMVQQVADVRNQTFNLVKVKKFWKILKNYSKNWRKKVSLKKKCLLKTPFGNKFIVLSDQQPDLHSMQRNDWSAPDKAWFSALWISVSCGQALQIHQKEGGGWWRGRPVWWHQTPVQRRQHGDIGCEEVM